MPKTQVPTSGRAEQVKHDSTKSFEASMQELETLIARMGQQQFGLSDLVTQYQRGVELIQTCKGMLSQAQEEVRLLDDRLQADGLDPARTNPLAPPNVI